MANARVDAMNARTVGNQTRLFDHSQKTATKPPLVPDHLHHAYTPPPLSESIVASSAPARESGIRNRIVPIIYHPMDDHPNSAIDGKFRIDSTAATLIIASAKMPSTFFGAEPVSGP